MLSVTDDVMFLLPAPLLPQREKLQVEESLKDVRRNEEDISQSNQSLLSRLEDTQVTRCTRAE